MKYLVIIETGPKSYGAYVPDVPGCVAIADTRAEVKKLIREAIEMHLALLQESGEQIPKPRSGSEYVEAAVA
jgi:predicted RNase H-like HicB family nuclease